MYLTNFSIWSYANETEIVEKIRGKFTDLRKEDIEIGNGIIWFRTDYNPYDENPGKSFVDMLKKEYPSIGIYMTAQNCGMDLVCCQWCASASPKVRLITNTDCVVLESTIDWILSCENIRNQIEKNPSWEPSFTPAFDDEDFDDDFDDEFEDDEE